MRKSAALAISHCLAILLATGCEEPSLGSPSGRIVVRHGPDGAAPLVTARLFLAANRKTDALFNPGGGIDRVQVKRNDLDLQARSTWLGPTLVDVAFEDSAAGPEAVYVFQGLTADGRPVGASQSIVLSTKRTLDFPVLSAQGTASATPTFSWKPVTGARGYFLEIASPLDVAGTRIFVEAASTSYRYGDPALDAAGDRAVPAALEPGKTYGIRLAAYSLPEGESTYSGGTRIEEAVTAPALVAP